MAEVGEWRWGFMPVHPAKRKASLAATFALDIAALEAGIKALRIKAMELHGRMSRAE
jgi:hypothetical protein